MASMWFLFIGIVILSFSAFFGAYLAVFYTLSFKVASFAKATSVALFFIGIIMLFVTVGWWGFASIVGYWLFFTLSMVHWHKRFAAHLIAGTDPWHGMLQDEQLLDDVSKKDNQMKKYSCKICGYIYDPEKGDPDGEIAPGTPFEELPDDWTCPIYGVGKEEFEEV